jgi:hypothetical protein
MPEYPDNTCHYYITMEEIISEECEERIKVKKIDEALEKIYGLETLIKTFR